MPKIKTGKNSGFTLIELLVVISIIGFLATASVVVLNSARMKARDAKRRSDLKQVSTALEVYYDTNNSYPSTSSTWWGNCPTYGSHGISGANGWVPNLAPAYIPALPLDPKYNGAGGCYLYRSDGINYKLLAYTTTESVCPVPVSDPMYDGRVCTFQISSPGGSSW